MQRLPQKQNNFTQNNLSPFCGCMVCFSLSFARSDFSNLSALIFEFTVGIFCQNLFLSYLYVLYVLLYLHNCVQWRNQVSYKVFLFLQDILSLIDVTHKTALSIILSNDNILTYTQIDIIKSVFVVHLCERCEQFFVSAVGKLNKLLRSCKFCSKSH